MDKIRDGTFNRPHGLPVNSMVWQTLRQLINLGRHHPAINRTIFIIILVVGALLIWIGYAQARTTFDEQSLRDWFALFVVLVMLAGGAVLLKWLIRRNEQRTDHELKIAEWYAQHEHELEADRFREAAFQTYLDRMTELLLDKGLRRSEPGAEIRDIARARTLTVLREVDGPYKGILLRFLYEANLIKRQKIIDLSGADLRGAHLKEIDLREADLSGADLSGADLGGANLQGANLQGAVLIVADLSRADLGMANLSQTNLAEAVLTVTNLNEANLSCADLHGANLEGAELMGVNLGQANLREVILIVANLIEANLSDAILSGANLAGADLIEANLAGADLSRANLSGVNLRGARYTSQTKWPQRFVPSAAGAVLVD